MSLSLRGRALQPYRGQGSALGDSPGHWQAASCIRASLVHQDSNEGQQHLERQEQGMAPRARGEIDPLCSVL